MREEYLDCYADYLIKYVEEYEKCGIHISALTPQNEPETLQKNQMPACVWHPDHEAKFISILRRKLTELCEKEGIELYLPPLNLCGDNGAMIGAQGYYEYLAGNTADMSLNAYATKSILGEAL